MGRSYFHFKEFTIWQHFPGLKVTTDACLLGALSHHHETSKILDIGTGTGLLALMLAQKYPGASIDALDMQPGAVEQAQTNFSSSPWANHLHLACTRIQDFVLHDQPSYDLIIVNPPFFSGMSASKNSIKASAIHNNELPLGDLIAAIEILLDQHGSCWVMYPPFEAGQCLAQAYAKGLYLEEDWEILNYPGSDVFRRIMRLSKNENTPEHHQLCIRNAPGKDYSDLFIALLKPYYLTL